MTLKSGSYSLGPEDGQLLVRTGREGAAARMGHDLTLLATRWAATVTIDVEDPPRSTVSATVDAASLVVREASGGPVALTDSQRAEIESNVRAKVLQSDRYPQITFESTAVEGGGARASITGDLTVGRRTRPAVLALQMDQTGSPRIVASTAIIQTAFEIKPYSALLGTLRVKDVVEVTIEVRLPAS